MSDINDEKTSKELAWEATPDAIALAIQEQATKFYSDGRLERSQELLEKLVKMRPKAGPVWGLLGVVHRRQKRMVKALQCLQKAAELDPTDRNSLVNLGECLVIAGKVEEGAKILHAVFEMGYDEDKAPEDHDVFTRRAGAQLALMRKVFEAVEAGEVEG